MNKKNDNKPAKKRSNESNKKRVNKAKISIKVSQPKQQPKPWELQPGETAKAFAAFEAYRDLGGNRSYPKTAEVIGKSRGLIANWGAKFDWVNRANLWDDETDRIIRAELTKNAVVMRKRHVEIAVGMQMKALQGLRNLSGDLCARDIATLVDVAAKLERLSRGERTDITECKAEISAQVSQKIDFSLLSSEELDCLEKLAENLGNSK